MAKDSSEIFRLNQGLYEYKKRGQIQILPKAVSLFSPSMFHVKQSLIRNLSVSNSIRIGTR